MMSHKETIWKIVLQVATENALIITDLGEACKAP